MQVLEERTLAGLHSFLESAVADVPRSSAVLDIGCGTGAWLERLKRLGFTELWGIDNGTRPAIGDIRFVSADLDREMPRLETKFGLITLIEVIEHLANPGAVLSFVSSRLRDGGLVLLTTPNIHSLRCRVKFMLTGRLASFDDKGDPTHVSPVLISGFRKIAARAGLVVTASWTYPLTRSLIFGRPIRTAASVLRLVVQDPFPGDTLCMTLRRSSGDEHRAPG